MRRVLSGARSILTCVRWLARSCQGTTEPCCGPSGPAKRPPGSARRARATDISFQRALRCTRWPSVICTQRRRKSPACCRRRGPGACRTARFRGTRPDELSLNREVEHDLRAQAAAAQSRALSREHDGVAIGSTLPRRSESASRHSAKPQRALDVRHAWTHPGDLIDIDMDAVDGEGVIHLSNADYLTRPLRLSADEALALVLALRTLREIAGPGKRDPSTEP